MPLSAIDYEVISYIEQFYLLNRIVPSTSMIAERVCKDTDLEVEDEDAITENVIKNILKKESVQQALSARGIPDVFKYQLAKKNTLSAIQLMVANTLLDFTDNRSHKKKLADLSVSSQTYQGWLRDPAFQSYLVQRAEAILPDSMAEAHLALVDNVRRGDLGSIKLFYEMTGRFTNKAASEVNIEFLLMKIIEVIQKHVTDPVVLSAIGDELSTLSKPTPVGNIIEPPPSLPPAGMYLEPSLKPAQTRPPVREYRLL